MSLPIVSIVGRPNVGKSSLLNCLAGRRISIVEATPGVTRDRVSTTICLSEFDDETPRFVELVDTGGMGIEDADNLTEDVESQIRFGILTAAVILFVVDAREGITALDRHVAEKLRKQNKPVILLANKIDTHLLNTEIGELNRLGFGDPLDISAKENRNIDLVLERLNEALKHLPPEAPHEPVLKLAIVGKRNAGKSTFINALAGEERVIVSEMPGTTRDAVDVMIDHNGQKLMLIDTAGVKRTKKIASDIEYYSQHRAMRSVRRADVVALMIDASEPVSQVDKNLAGIIAEEFKPVLIVVNKWDLAKDFASTEDYADYFAKTFPSLAYAPISITVANKGTNVHATISLAEQLFQQANFRVTTGQLNNVMETILAKRGPSHHAGTRPPKIYYTSQVDVAPPTIVCFVNDVRSFDQSFQRFLVNQFREFLPFNEVPIRLFIRQSKSGHDRKTQKD